jgi:hypothetical protein
VSPGREDGFLQARPPGKKGTRADTGDAEGEGDHATSTGVVADLGAPGMEARPEASCGAWRTRTLDWAISRRRPPPTGRPCCASAGLAKIERDEGDQGGDEQEDRIHY